GLTAEVNFFEAYSFKYTAMLTPTGTASKVAIKVVKMVPERRGKIPKCLSSNRGVHSRSVKNSMIDTSEKNLTVSTDRTKIIPIVVRTEIKLQKIINASMNLSDLIGDFAISYSVWFFNISRIFAP